MSLKSSILKEKVSSALIKKSGIRPESLDLRFSRFIPAKHDQELIYDEFIKIFCIFKKAPKARLSIVKESDFYHSQLELETAGDQLFRYSSIALSLSDVISELKSKVLKDQGVVDSKAFYKPLKVQTPQVRSVGQYVLTDRRGNA